MKIVVLGAEGWIGRRVLNLAESLGMEVLPFSKTRLDIAAEGRGKPLDIGTDRVLEIAGDRAIHGADALIHCAGYVHRAVETPEEREKFFAINQEGSRRVVEIAQRAGIQRVVYLSSIAFYDWEQGTNFVEDGPLAAPTAYAASKLGGENYFRESGLDWRIARLGTVFGEGDKANFAKLAQALAKGRFVLPGDGAARKSVLPVRLAAELLVELALMPEPRHRLLNLALPETPSLGQICETFSEHCGFPPPRRVPHFALQALAKAGDVAARLHPSFPLTTNTLRKLMTSTTVNVEAMMETFPDRRWADFSDWLKESAEYYTGL